jgi:tRNA pseudouridine38-40 synthase
LVTDTKIVLILEYNGARYHGFQLQASQPTVQGEVEKAIRKLTGEKRRVMAASRTDAGVHARGQVASFKTGASLAPQTFTNGLNHYLPRDIAVRAAHRVSDSFNVRREATSREYIYYILNSQTRSPIWEGFAHLVPGQLDIEAMNQACHALIGKHDFTSFVTGAGDSLKSAVKCVYRAEIARDGEMAIFNIAANSFIAHQVRNTVGALIGVGRGKMTAGDFTGIIKAKEPGLAGPMAPASGLYLTRVNYPNSWERYSENL